MAHINRLAALEGLGVDAALHTVLAESSGCHGEEKPGSICLACRWSFCVFFLALLLCLKNSFTSSWLRRQLSFCLKIVVDKCLEILFDSASLLSFFMFILLFFLRAIVWGGMSAGVRMVTGEGEGEGWGEEGGYVLLSTSQQYLLSHSHL